MKEDFDFNRIGKRLPYTTPDSFLDDIENNVWETVKQEEIFFGERTARTLKQDWKRMRICRM